MVRYFEIGYGTYRIVNIRVIAKPDRCKRFIRPEDSRTDPELTASGSRFGSQSLHGVFKDFIHISVRQRAGPHLESVIERSIKHVDHCIWIDIGAKSAPAYSFKEVFNRHSSSGHGPSFSKRLGKFGIELSLGEKHPNQGAVFPPKRLCHRSHLKPDTFGEKTRWREERARIDPRHERVHDDRCFIRPAPINGHPADSRLR